MLGGPSASSAERLPYAHLSKCCRRRWGEAHGALARSRNRDLRLIWGVCPPGRANATNHAKDFLDFRTRRVVAPEGRFEPGHCKADTRTGHSGGSLLSF